MLRVYPSGSDLEKVVNPVAPPAPGRFLMTTGTFRYFSITGASIRNDVSPPPPGPAGIMIVMALLGNSSPEAREEERHNKIRQKTKIKVPLRNLLLFIMRLFSFHFIDGVQRRI